MVPHCTHTYHHLIVFYCPMSEKGNESSCNYPRLNGCLTKDIQTIKEVIFTDRHILLTSATWMQMLYIFGPTMTCDVMYWMMRIKLSGWGHRESLQCMYQLWRGLCKALIESCHSPSSSSKHTTCYILSSSGSSTIIVLFYCTVYLLISLFNLFLRKRKIFSKDPLIGQFNCLNMIWCLHSPL